MNGFEKKLQETSFGEIAYVEVGSREKPPVLFVHGIPTSSYLWRHVLRLLQNDFCCYAPDLMGLGDSRVDPDRDLFHMDAQAEMLEELMRSLGHERFALVCHDQGGAAAQILAANRPELLSCFVVTDCVCYDNWPVPDVVELQRLARVPLAARLAVRSRLLEHRELRTPLSVMRKGVYDRSKLGDESIREYLRPMGTDEGLERFLRFVLAGSPRYTLAAVEGLRRFDKPTLVLWAGDDVFLSPSWGKRLAEEIPGAVGFELVPFCGHFWQEERPAEVASLMGTVLAAHAGDAEGGGKS